MANTSKTNSAGFTIIETLIVLAIAGVIMLIVFMAIPALMRNSRNNQRKQDVAAILEAISHYELNHNGGFLDCGYSTYPACVGAGSVLGQVDLSYYDPANVFVYSQTPSTTLQSDRRYETDIVRISNYRKCDPNDSGQRINTGAGYNDVAAIYAVETGDGSASQCQEL